MLTGGSSAGCRKRSTRPTINNCGCRVGTGYGLDADPGFAIIRGQVQRMREIGMMRSLTVAAVMLALIAAPAQAQMKGKRPQGDDRKTGEKKPQVDEKAYKAALERIREPKEKYDPWGVARPAEPAKKSR